MALIKVEPFQIDTVANFVFGNTTITSNANIANLSVTTTANLGAVGNIKITGGTANAVLKTDGAGNLSWGTSSGGGASVTVSSTAPSTPSNGDLWLDSESGELNVYFGGAWGSVSETSPQFVSTVNSFTGDSLTTQFTLSTTPAAKEYTLVAIGGVLQPKSTYSISGNVLTTSSAVPSNTPIEVTILGGTAAPIGSASTVTAGAQPNITSVGTLTSVTTSGDGTIGGNLTVTGNGTITGNLSVTGNLTMNNGIKPATTGKAIAMAIVFGF